MALAALVVLVLAGCGGGGGSSASETTIRKKLQAGAAKLGAADSFEASILFEVEEEGEAEEIGCLDLAIDGRKPERFDMTFFDLNCSGGGEAHELVAIGRHAWASSSEDPGSWEAAKIAPSLLHQVGGEQTNLKHLFDAAENLEASPEGGAVEEGETTFVDVPSYSFEAPASAFPESSGDDSDVKVEFEAVLDRKGYLRELTLHGDEEDTGATVTEKYERVGQDQGISPPDPAEVHGPRTTIRSREDFDELFGVPAD